MDHPALPADGYGVGYSRIYLGQHFLEDVLAGSIVGGCLRRLGLCIYSGAEILWTQDQQ